MVGRFSEEEKARFAEERRLQLQKMHADVADKVAELVNGDAWQEWLSVAAMFHRYPVRPDRQIVGRSVARPAVDDETADASTRARRVPESFRALALSPVTRRSVLLGRSWGSPPGVQGGSSNEAQHRTRGCEVADPLDSEVVHRQGAKGAGQRGGVAVVGRETVPGKDGHPGRPADDHGLEVAERDHGADTDGPHRVSLLVGLPHRDPHNPCTDAPCQPEAGHPLSSPAHASDQDADGQTRQPRATTGPSKQVTRCCSWPTPLIKTAVTWSAVNLPR